MSTHCPKYLFYIIPSSESYMKHLIWYMQETETFIQLQNWLFQIFFLSKLSIWMVTVCARNTELRVYCSFQKQTCLFIWPSKRSIFNVNDPEGVKYQTRLCLRFSHLNEHKFRHGFLDILNLLCNAVWRLKTVNIFFCAASILKILEGPT